MYSVTWRDPGVSPLFSGADVLGGDAAPQRNVLRQVRLLQRPAVTDGQPRPPTTAGSTPPLYVWVCFCVWKLVEDHDVDMESENPKRDAPVWMKTMWQEGKNFNFCTFPSEENLWRGWNKSFAYKLNEDIWDLHENLNILRKKTVRAEFETSVKRIFFFFF